MVYLFTHRPPLLVQVLLRRRLVGSNLRCPFVLLTSTNLVPFVQVLYAEVGAVLLPAKKIVGAQLKPNYSLHYPMFKGSPDP